jgi:hypothetical protein
MPRIDDYINAREITVNELRNVSLEQLIERSGFRSIDDAAMRVPFLDRTYRVGYPDFEFIDEEDESNEVPIQEQVLVLHYLKSAGPHPVTGQWVAYREIPGASFYFSAFVKRAIDPLKNVFGQNISGLQKAAEILKGVPIDPGDAGFEFRVFPNVSLQMILYAGDEEFPAEASILFDGEVGEILSPEDIAWMAGMVVYRLIALAR